MSFSLCDLVIFDFSIFGPLTCHFQSDLTLFALIAHNCQLGNADFTAGARNFCSDHVNFVPIASDCRLDVAIFAPVSFYFRSFLVIFLRQ